VFGTLPKDVAPNAYRLMLSCVLATDMARHAESLNQFEAMCTGEGFDKQKEQHRLVAMQMLMKAADISNVTKPFQISRQWSVAVTEEFYQQGDKERARGLAVLPMTKSTGPKRLRAFSGSRVRTRKGIFLIFSSKVRNCPTVPVAPVTKIISAELEDAAPKNFQVFAFRMVDSEGVISTCAALAKNLNAASGGSSRRAHELLEFFPGQHSRTGTRDENAARFHERNTQAIEVDVFLSPETPAFLVGDEFVGV
jgi:hypothetical protein